MKKFKTQYIPDATMFDKKIMVCYFQTLLARYGKILHNGKYKLEFLLPIESLGGWSCVTIYYSKKKPKIRNLYLLSVLWIPFYLLLCILIPAIFLVFVLAHIVFGFYYNCLFRKSFITDGYETLSGYISLALSIIGLISLIKFFL